MRIIRSLYMISRVYTSKQFWHKKFCHFMQDKLVNYGTTKLLWAYLIIFCIWLWVKQLLLYTLVVTKHDQPNTSGVDPCSAETIRVDQTFSMSFSSTVGIVCVCVCSDDTLNAGFHKGYFAREEEVSIIVAVHHLYRFEGMGIYILSMQRFQILLRHTWTKY